MILFNPQRVGNLSLYTSLQTWQEWVGTYCTTLYQRSSCCLCFSKSGITCGFWEITAVSRQALKRLRFGILVWPNLVWPALVAHRSLGACSLMQTFPRAHLLHRLGVLLLTCFTLQLFFLFQGSAVSRRVWLWTGFKGSWVFCRIPSWGEFDLKTVYIYFPLHSILFLSVVWIPPGCFQIWSRCNQKFHPILSSFCGLDQSFGTCGSRNT